jgi:hypothetical protein
MLRPQLADKKLGQNFVGLGWFCSGKDDEFQFGHGGADEGFLAEIKLFPIRGTGAVVMINSIQGWPILNETLKAIGREYSWPLHRTLPVATAMPIGITYSGLYRDDDGTTFEISQLTEGLCLQFGHQSPLPLCPASEEEFFATAVNLRVRFEKIDAGTPTSMTVIQGEKVISLTRAKTEKPH